MLGELSFTPRQRAHPRIAVESLCTEMDGDQLLRHALAIDLSPDGLRIQRPVGGTTPRRLQIEFEIPGIDEVLWAVGEVRFDEVWRVPPTSADRPSGVLRTSGIQIVAAASQHRRLLREYVLDTWGSAEAELDERRMPWSPMAAAPHRRGQA